MKDKKRLIENGLFAVVIIWMLFLISSFFQYDSEYKRFNMESIKYEKAVVTDILEQELTLTGADGEYMTGFQRLTVQFTEGDDKGKEIEISHSITLVHNIVCKKGMRVIICADRPEGTEPYYTIYNYDRSAAMWGILATFILVIVLIGKVKGAKSSVGLGFTMAMVVCFMVPALFEGYSPWLVTGFTVIVCSVVSCFCISGLEKKTVCNMIGTSMGGISAGIIYLILANIMHMNAGTMDEAEALQLISASTGMTLEGVMFAGIMVGALGAVMDVAVSMGASLWELKERKPEITSKELFVSGMNIGKDMIGTMTNTLILAFVGGCLPTLLIYISYGIQYHQFISSNFLAIELVQGIAGSMAVILTVPFSAFVCSIFYNNVKNH